jgi:hypothetical protein
MSLPDRSSRPDVFELLELLLSRGGERAWNEIPARLEPALCICLAGPEPWVRMQPSGLPLLTLEGMAAYELWAGEAHQAGRAVNRGGARVMPSAARETEDGAGEPGRQPDPLSPYPYPVHIASIAPEVAAQLRPTATQPSLSDPDRYILTILAARRTPLTYDQIIRESVRMEQEDRTKVRRLSDRTLRDRVLVLLDHGLVERPPRTRKKGICITEAGIRALQFAAGN